MVGHVWAWNIMGWNIWTSHLVVFSRANHLVVRHIWACHLKVLSEVRSWHMLERLSVMVSMMVLKICVLITVMVISRCSKWHLVLMVLRLHLTFQKAVFLFSTNVVVLVTLLCLLSFYSSMLWHRLCTDRLELGRLVRVNIMELLRMVGLHFKN